MVEYDFGDIRTAIDEAHRDDTLKSYIKADLSAYIVKDPLLGETLHKFRSSGKKLFILTNSLYDYTSVVMSYLLDGERKAYPSWRNYFDIVIVGGAKPAFFNELRPFVQVDPVTGAPNGHNGEIKHLSRDKVYQGGNVVAFEQMTGIRGEHVLYIGDHIYGDILRLRKQHMWRTALVLQELEREISVSDRLEAQIRDLERIRSPPLGTSESRSTIRASRLKKIQRLLDDDSTSPSLRARGAPRRGCRSAAARSRAGLMDTRVQCSGKHMDLIAYSPHWGSCTAEGGGNSPRFGEQVNDHADLCVAESRTWPVLAAARCFRAPRRPRPRI